MFSLTTIRTLKLRSFHGVELLLLLLSLQLVVAISVQAKSETATCNRVYIMYLARLITLSPSNHYHPPTPRSY